MNTKRELAESCYYWLEPILNSIIIEFSFPANSYFSLRNPVYIRRPVRPAQTFILSLWRPAQCDWKENFMQVWTTSLR